LEDRTSFRTTAKELWKSPELNTQRDCLVEVQPDGCCTPSTELENWPRHAPMPARMRMRILLEDLEHGEGLLAFLDSCWVVPRRRHLFSGLKTLQLQVQLILRCSLFTPDTYGSQLHADQGRPLQSRPKQREDLSKADAATARQSGEY
jgi:hypothetical protein